MKNGCFEMDNDDNREMLTQCVTHRNTIGENFNIIYYVLNH